jgi:NAD(P)H-dependent flavin oxidoreductase YrpB (nitropropane dioxygenase family)
MRPVLSTAFTELVGCQVPIQLAGMPQVSVSRLAAAVANAGGLGMVVTPPDQTVQVLKQLANETTGKFGINFLIPFLDLDAVEAASPLARVVDFHFGEPHAGLVDRVHRGGALAGWQVGSADEARAAADAGCDFVVAQGTEAGGHVRGKLPLLLLLEEVLDAVEVPVLASGGIASARTMAAALAAGASGVRVGTRFVASTESGAHPRYIEMLLRARSTDTVLTTTFSVGWPDAPHRVLRSCVEAAENFQGEMVGEEHLESLTIPIPRLWPLPPGNMTSGEIEAMALYAGESVGMVDVVKPAAAIVAELAEGAEQLLGRRA